MKHRKSCSLPVSPSFSSSAPRSPTSPSEPEPEFVELLARSNFSFLQGASHPEELVLRAKLLGYKGLAISDSNGLYGVVRGYQAAEKPSVFDAEQLQLANADGTPKRPFHYMCGTELSPYDSGPLVLLPMNKDGYVRLCRLLTTAKRRAPKGHIVVSLKDILEANEDQIVFPLPPWNEKDLRKLQDAFQDRIYLPVHKDFTWESIRFYREALRLEQTLHIPLFATQRPLFHEEKRKPLHDVLTCILHKTTLKEAATNLALNRERYMKPAREIAHLFRERPDLLGRTLEIAARIDFSLSELRYRYPQEHLPAGKTATEFLRDLVEEGIRWRYHDVPRATGRKPRAEDKARADDRTHLSHKNTPTKTDEYMARVRKQVEDELAIIKDLEYEDYFLTLWDICNFAGEQGILYQGRGSAANSIVCYALGLTNIDPIEMKLLFERFLSRERAEPPDIDIDFEHEKREQVIQYIYGKYGAARAAMVCTVICYRSRMAVREIAKTFGIGLPQIDQLIKYMGREGLSNLIAFAFGEGAEDDDDEEERPRLPPKPGPMRSDGSVSKAKPVKDIVLASDSKEAAGPRTNVPAKSPAHPVAREPGADLDLDAMGLSLEKLQLILALAREMQGFPRHLGIHSGGFVISQDPVIDIVPVEAATMDDRYVIQWNKDDINILGLMKVDVLSLGMLSAVRRSLDLLRSHKGHDWNMAQVPHDDRETYEMIQDADTVGVFQIESRAQMSLLPRLRPKDFYDLVIEVAIVRPGPIQGGMVHPYLRRRQGKEKITYAHKSLEPILEKTHGIPLFQEQVMQIAVVAAGFTPGESDELRRVVSSAWKKKQVMEGLRQRVINGMLANNIAREYAEQIYKTIQGFASYGFPESHAASFALITYVSCYLKRHFPDVFACALLNSQPMGFYSPRQLIADAQRHGVEFRPLDVQHSDWDYTLETTPAITLSRHKHAAVCAHAVRTGLRSVHGLREAQARHLVEEREKGGPFRDLSDLVRRTRLPRAALIRLAAAGALGSLGHQTREALWKLQGMSFDERSMFFGRSLSLDPEREEAEGASLPEENDWETVRREYQNKGFSIDKHPMGVLRSQLAAAPQRYATARDLEKMRDRAPIRIAGLMSLMQKPPTAKGMCFVSMEDETGLINVVITPDVYQTCRLLLQQRPLLDVEGRLESREGVRNVRALKVRALLM